MTQNGNNSAKFRTKMPLAVTALLRSGSMDEAAQAVQISLATLKRWRQRPEFARALRDAQAEIFLLTMNELRNAGRDCAIVLAKIARDENAPAPSRVRAAMAVVTLLLKLNHADNVEVRLAAIEHALRQRKGANR